MKRPFSLRALTSVLIAISFVVIVLSGIILFIAPPGRIANWTDWGIAGLTKTEWGALHMVFATVFLVGSLAHLWFNWRPMVSYFRSRLPRGFRLRWEWVVALGFCALVYGGVRADWPPMSSLLALNEDFKSSWDQQTDRAPIPHAELLTLAELAREANVDMELAKTRLAAKGIEGTSGAVVVKDLATQNRISAQTLYAYLAEPGAQEQKASGQDSGSHMGGAGGGTGRLTLQEFCAQEQLDLDQGLQRLRDQGYEAGAELTLREIALTNGLDRPYVLLEILREK